MVGDGVTAQNEPADGSGDYLRKAIKAHYKIGVVRLK